jgi:hypothetical protein
VLGGPNKVWPISSKLSSLNTQGRPGSALSCMLPCHENSSPDEILLNCLARGIGERIPKLISASYVNTRCQAVFDSEQSALVKRHPGTSTVWIQLSDASRLRHHVICVGPCIVSDVVCFLTQSSCIELRPSTNIVIWDMLLVGRSAEGDVLPVQLPRGLGRGLWSNGHCDPGFDTRSKLGYLSSSFCVLLFYVGRSPATGRSPKCPCSFLNSLKNLPYVSRPRFFKNCRATE